VPLATALCINLPAENTQRWFSRPKPTRVAVPIEEELNHVKIIEAALTCFGFQRNHHQGATASA